MKVRKKFLNKSAEYEVIEESPSYFIVQARPQSLERLVFDKCDMEPAPEQDHWEDVTGECDVIPQIGTNVWFVVKNDVLRSESDGYRLRKVKLFVRPVSPSGWAEEQDAFIVERKVSESTKETV